MFDRGMHAEALLRLQTENDLRRAVDREDFELYYQPIVSLTDGRPVAVEALLRWRHQERGIVTPGEFIPVAEDTGLIVPLGRWALREACRQVRRWLERVPGVEPIRLSVNLSVREFTQTDLVREVARVLAESGLPPQHLQLEITESVVLGNGTPAVETIEELKALGVRMHLDDFGTGYSSLSYLHRLPLDAIKVDRAFTSNIDVEERPRHVVRAILDLVGAIGLESIAEGVTRAEQVELLREMGCTYAQGYFYAMPMTAVEMETWLTRAAAA
jgi:EAL domain-containing protein (putative c-di-GMP-specific phosphodiesterase class I)